MLNKKFSERINKETKVIFDGFFKNTEWKKVFEKRTIAMLLGESLPDSHLPIGPISKKEAYLSSVFRKYFEVSKSIDRMKLCKNFISKTSSIKNISRLDYMMYHYEYYLNEMYIYTTRVNQFLDFIIKECRKAGMLKEIKKVETQKKIFNDAMENIKKVRGLHVHEKRHDSNKISQLTELELLADKFDFLDVYGKMELKKFRKKTLAGMEGNIDILEKFIEETVYDDIGELIFDTLLSKK